MKDVAIILGWIALALLAFAIAAKVLIWLTGLLNFSWVH